VRRHFAVEPWTDLVEVHWADRAEAYVTPVGPSTVGVALLRSGSGGTFDDMMVHFPSLAGRLAGARAASRDRGAGPLEQRARAVVGGGMLLVGDASGYLDAITGEGLSLAFHHAFAAVDAITAGDLDSYAAAHRRIARLPMAMTRLVLMVERHPWLRRRLIRALAGDGDLFSRLLAIHVRQLPVSGLGLGGALRLLAGLAAG
jgi:flavin-dependent dehydrogenase